MMEKTIYIVMCKSVGDEYAWEAREDRLTAYVRAKNLAFKNPGASFRVLKTKLVTGV